jgi:protein SCO1/2
VAGERKVMKEETALQNNGSFLQRYWFVVAAVVLALAIAAVFGYQYWQSTRIPVMKPISDFTLEKLDGTPFQFSKDTNGKVRLVSFIFTNCPDVCPPTTKNMQNMQEELKAKGMFGEDVVFLTITFDPERDTAEVLRRYAEKFSYDPNGWYFLRGSEQAVQQVTKDFGVGVLKQEDGMFLHTMVTFLIDKEGNMRKTYGMGADMNKEQIISDMEQLADE